MIMYIFNELSLAVNTGLFFILLYEVNYIVECEFKAKVSSCFYLGNGFIY